MKRRTFLKGAGAAVVVVSGGTVWHAHQRGVFSPESGPAYEPWTDWRGEAADGPLALVRAAILAASPHNTQPWLFRIDESSIELYADLSRDLGAFDPYLREMYIGLGCAVENMVLAAGPNGYEVEVMPTEGRLQLDADGRAPALAATLKLSTAERRDNSLYRAIPIRRTDRGPYDSGRALPDSFAQGVASLMSPQEANELSIHLSPESFDKDAFGAAVIAATEAIIDDETMVHDSERWYRHTWREVQEHRDGPTLDAAGLAPLPTAIAKMLPRASPETNHQYWLDATRDVHIPTAAAFGVIAVKNLYDRRQNLLAGRLWQRVHLWAATAGLSMQPLNQLMERVDRESALGTEPTSAGVLERLLGADEHRATFGFRVGYPLRAPSASPRRPVSDVLMS